MGNDRPTITTIIPTYRRPKLLRRAIQSALAQTYRDIKVCVYDNDSGDETGSVVKDIIKEDSRVVYHKHEENIGGMANFNYGLSHVDTPFFSFLSDDDLLLPDFYKTAMDGFNDHPEAMMSAGSTLSVFEGNVYEVPMRSWKREGLFAPPESLLSMLNGDHPTWTGVVFRREVVDAVGLLDKDVGMPIDLDFELRVAARFPVVVLKKPCAIFSLSSTSSSGSSDYRYVWPGWLKMIKNVTEDERIPEETRKQTAIVLNKRLIDWLYVLGKRSALNKNYSSAREAATILRDHFKKNDTARKLELLTSICQGFDPARRLMAYAQKENGVRKKPEFKEYDEYLKYLKI